MLTRLICGDSSSPLYHPSCTYHSWSCYIPQITKGLLVPFLTMLCRQGGSTLIRFNKIWKPCLILGEQAVILCFGIRSVVANFKLYTLMQKLFWLCLSHISLMFRVNFVESCTSRKVSVSLLDSDDSSDSEVESHIFLLINWKIWSVLIETWSCQTHPMKFSSKEMGIKRAVMCYPTAMEG